MHVSEFRHQGYNPWAIQRCTLWRAPFIVLYVISSTCLKCGLSIHFYVPSRASSGTGNRECLSGECVEQKDSKGAGWRGDRGSRLLLASCLVPGGNEPCPSVGMEVEIASGRSIKWGIHSAKSDKPTVNSDRQQLTLGERTETQGFELLDIFLMTSDGPIAKFKEF